jgi:type IV secretion system protein VirD4
MQKSFSGSGFFLSNRSESEQEYARPLLTPAEVNQLSQDDGILLVGGLLPYRARKVRYFLDPRFKGRDGMPTPDAPEEQSRELPPAVPNDWEGHVVVPPTAPSSPEASPLPVQTPDPPTASPPSSSSSNTTSPAPPPAAATEGWGDFFASGNSEPETAATAESTTEAEDLPL